MKKTIFTLLCLILASALMAGSGFDLNPNKVIPGKEVLLDVTISFTEPTVAAEFQVNYNPKALTFVKMVKSDITEDTMHAVNDVRGKLRVAFASAEPFTESGGTLCTLIFKVKDKQLSKTEFSMSRTLINDIAQGNPVLPLNLLKPVNRAN